MSQQGPRQHQGYRDGGIDVIVGDDGETMSISKEDLAASEEDAREASRIAAAMKLLEVPLTEALDTLAKVRLALEDPGELTDDEYADFIDGHSLANDEEDALLQVSRRYAIAKLNAIENALRFAGAKP